MTKQKIPQGYKETQVGWIPEEWECPSVLNACDIIVSPVDKKTKEGESLVQLCNYTDVYYNKRITSALDFMKASASKREIQKCALRKGDVVITKDSETPDDIGVPTFIAEDIDNLVCGYHLTILRSKSCLLGEYLSYVLQLHIIQYEFFRFAAGVTRFGLTADTYKQVHLPLPSLPEQKKIAAILGKWDEGIEKTENLIQSKQRLKKALCQQLLTGKKRFKEFRKQPWNSIELKTILVPQIRAVVKPSKSFLALGIRSHGKGTFQKPNFEPQKIALEELYKVKTNDLIVNITFAWEGAIAIVDEYDDDALVSHRFPTYVFDKQKGIPEYFRHVILQKRFVYELGLVSPGGAGRNRVLSKKDFLKIKVNIPTVEEQQKIASVLNAADKEIDLLSDKLEALKNQKKGLMQKLLTGKIRVKV